jgi:hypothetical protein
LQHWLSCKDPAENLLLLLQSFQRPWCMVVRVLSGVKATRCPVKAQDLELDLYVLLLTCCKEQAGTTSCVS